MLVNLTVPPGGQAFLFNASLIRLVRPDPQGRPVTHVQAHPPGGQPLERFEVAEDVAFFSDLPGFARVMVRERGGYNLAGVNLAHVARMVSGGADTALSFVGEPNARLVVREKWDALLALAPPSLRAMELHGAGAQGALVAFNLDHVLDVMRSGTGASLRFVDDAARHLRVEATVAEVLDMGGAPPPDAQPRP